METAVRSSHRVPLHQPDPRAPGRRDHLQVVERPGRGRQRQRRARALLFAGLGAVAFVCFALVYLHVLLAQRQFRVDHLNSQVQQEQAAYQQLRLHVAELGSPAHIVATAEGQLGMQRPANVSYLTPSRSVPTAPATGQASEPASVIPAGSTGPVTAPAGDADWPTIKSQLAGMP